MKKRRKNTSVLRFPALFAVLLLLCLCVIGRSARAADLFAPDPGRNGSITVTLHADGEGGAVTDGTLTIYEVASLYLDDGSPTYRYTEAFRTCGERLDRTDTTLASALVVWVEREQIAGSDAAIGEDGAAIFRDLKPGCYLVRQTKASRGYYDVDAFLVTLPMEGEQGWIYDVNASPKTQALVPKNGAVAGKGIENKSGTYKKNRETGNTGGTNRGESSILPQTGQLCWPIPVLAIGGLLLFVIGFGFSRNERKRSDRKRTLV